jgi:hypothetical protein
MDIVVWLRGLGLGKYEAVFRENEIDETVLPNLTSEDLKDLGVSIVGHRRKIRCERADSNGHLSTRPAIGDNASCRARRRGRWRAPTCHGDVLRPRGFDQHLCGT